MENVPDKTAINAVQKDGQLEKRLTGLAPNPITIEGEQERESLGALVDTVTGDILARYLKAKNKADDRIGCLGTKMELHGAVAEALTVLMLCALVQEKRLKSEGKKHSLPIASTFIAGIIIAGVPGAVAAYFIPKANDMAWAWSD
jgi:hypothetical protein